MGDAIRFWFEGWDKKKALSSEGFTMCLSKIGSSQKKTYVTSRGLQPKLCSSSGTFVIDLVKKKRFAIIKIGDNLVWTIFDG